MEKFHVERGEIYLVQLGPVRGREINQKWRPAVVLSLNDLNSKDLVVVVAPGTSVKSPSKRNYKNEAVIEPSPSNGLFLPTVFQAHQLRAIDKSRIKRGGNGFSREGILSSAEMTQVKNAILFTLGLDARFVRE